MSQSPHVIRVVVTAEMLAAVDALTERMAAAHPSLNVSRSAVARDCIAKGLPFVEASLPKAKR